MKFLIASLVLLAGLTFSQGSATSGSQYPTYNLSNYISWKCNGDTTCINSYPTLSNLQWQPNTNLNTSNPFLYQNRYWTWVSVADNTKYYTCKQDYFPYGPNLSICVKYAPWDSNYDI